MGKVDDILFDDDYEDVVKDGDDAIGDSTELNFKLLIVCEKAENKMALDSGVGIATWLLDEADGGDLKKDIQSEIEADGATIQRLNVDGESIDLKASYGN